MDTAGYRFFFMCGRSSALAKRHMPIGVQLASCLFAQVDAQVDDRSLVSRCTSGMICEGCQDGYHSRCVTTASARLPRDQVMASLRYRGRTCRRSSDAPHGAAETVSREIAGGPLAGRIHAHLQHHPVRTSGRITRHSSGAASRSCVRYGSSESSVYSAGICS